MADSVCGGGASRSMLNRWVLHFQKLGLQLKCPLCLSFLIRPTLLPCNHVFCNSCVSKSTHFEYECLVCKDYVADPDLRPVPFMENIVAIYKSLEASFCANMFQPVSSDGRTVLDQNLISPNISFCGKMTKEPFDNSQAVDSNSGQSIYSSSGNEGIWVPCTLNRSVAHGVDENGKLDKDALPIDGNRKVLELAGRRGTRFNGVGNPNLPFSSSQIRSGGLEESMTVERDTNQVAIIDRQSFIW